MGGDFEFLQSAPDARGGKGVDGGVGSSAHMWPADPDLFFLSARGGGVMHKGGEQDDKGSSTGKRMQRTNSHNRLVHEAASVTVFFFSPAPASLWNCVVYVCVCRKNMQQNITSTCLCVCVCSHSIVFTAFVRVYCDNPVLP
jgi:hypothetical protein